MNYITLKYSLIVMIQQQTNISFREHEVPYWTGLSDDVPVQRLIEPHYNFSLFADCVDSAADEYFFQATWSCLFQWTM